MSNSGKRLLRRNSTLPRPRSSHRHSPETLYLQAREHLALAVTADEQKKYQEAQVEYTQCCELNLLGIRNDTNAQRRHEMIGKVKQYLARAEAVRNKVANPNGSFKYNERDRGGLSEVAGLDNVKVALKESILLPLLQPQLFKGKRKPWKGVLLFGPPGTGKSYIMSKLSEEVEMNFIPLSAADIMSKWQGESEKAIREVFVRAKKLAKETGRKSLIFIDEIDSIGRKRDANTSDSSEESHRRVLTELLGQMDGLTSDSKDILVVGATNHAEDLDFALRRRFEKRIYLPLPGVKTRLEIIRKAFETHDDPAAQKSSSKGLTVPQLHNISKNEMIELARMTKGYSSADIAIILNEALMRPVRKAMHAEFFKVVRPNEEKTKGRMIGFLRRFAKNSLPAGDDQNYKLVECEANDPGAIPMQILDKDFPVDKLEVSPVMLQDVKDSINNLKPSVSEQEVQKHEAFALDFASGTQSTNVVSLRDLEEEVTDSELGFIDPAFAKKIRERNKRAEKDKADILVGLPSAPTTNNAQMHIIDLGSHHDEDNMALPG